MSVFISWLSYSYHIITEMGLRCFKATGNMIWNDESQIAGWLYFQIPDTAIITTGKAIITAIFSNGTLL